MDKVHTETLSQERMLRIIDLTCDEFIRLEKQGKIHKGTLSPEEYERIHDIVEKEILHLDDLGKLDTGALSQEEEARIDGLVLGAPIRSEKKWRDTEAKHDALIGKQIQSLEANKDKEFYISDAFQKAAFQELRNTFLLQEERGMLLLFREDPAAVIGDKFYDSDWMAKNHYGCAPPAPSFMIYAVDKENRYIPINGVLGSFSFKYDKVQKLAGQQGAIVITCHTHPHLAKPSSGDLEPSFCGIVIGFDTVNDSLEELLKHTFYKEPEFKEKEGKLRTFLKEKAGHTAQRNMPLLLQELYDKAIEECGFAMRLFYARRGEEPNEIPLLLRKTE